MRVLVFLMVVAPSLLYSQALPAPYPYLLRLSHEDSQQFSCVLLRKNGAYHIEVGDRDSTKVFEGTVPGSTLQEVEADLESDTLRSLSQAQIEEPLLRSRNDWLEVNVFRGDHWQILQFQSPESQRPFEGSLRPLLRLLTEPRRTSHRTLTEDEGKNNCLPAGVIALKRRTFGPSGKVFSPERPAPKAQRPAPEVQAKGRPNPLPTPALQTPAPLMRVDSTSIQNDDAHEFCILVAQNGIYRFEDRTQKGFKAPVITQIFTGQLPATDMDRLRQLVDDARLTKIRHREPPGGMVFIAGNMLNIKIWRSDGVQDLVLTSGFGREFGAFYGGDASISQASGLTQFLREHIEENRAGMQDPLSRNDCIAP